MPNILYATIYQNFRGMGIGLILNHQLYEGSYGCAGEVSSFMPLGRRRRFVEQAKKKYGEYAAIIQRLKSQEPGVIPVTDVIDAAEKGDDAEKYILREIAKVIGNELVRLVNLLDPYTIIIGGDISGAEKFTKQIIQ